MVSTSQYFAAVEEFLESKLSQMSDRANPNVHISVIGRRRTDPMRADTYPAPVNRKRCLVPDSLHRYPASVSGHICPNSVRVNADFQFLCE